MDTTDVIVTKLKKNKSFEIICGWCGICTAHDGINYKRGISTPFALSRYDLSTIIPNFGVCDEINADDCYSSFSHRGAMHYLSTSTTLLISIWRTRREHIDWFRLLTATTVKIIPYCMHIDFIILMLLLRAGMRDSRKWSLLSSTQICMIIIIYNLLRGRSWLFSTLSCESYSSFQYCGDHCLSSTLILRSRIELFAPTRCDWTIIFASSS